MSDDYTIESNCNRLESILGDLEREGLKEGTKESWVNAGMGVGGGLLDLVSAGLLIAPIPGARPASVALDQVAARMSQAQMLFSYSSRAQSMKKELEDMEIN